MKMSSIILLVVLMCFGAGDACAQKSGLIWGGVRHDDGITDMAVGFGKDLGGNLFGGNVWIFGSVGVGPEASVEVPEIALLFTVADNLYFGPVAGPHVNWVDIPPESDLAYLSGATGWLVGYDISDDNGIWLFGKFNYTFEADNLYRDGWQAGGGWYKRF